jgi:CBS-domain-containing membrane protein
MEQYQVRRVPVVDNQRRCIGIVAQADVALTAQPKQISKVVTEISKPHRPAWRKLAA